MVRLCLLPLFWTLSFATEFSFTCLEGAVSIQEAKELCQGENRELLTIRNNHENYMVQTLLRTESCPRVENVGSRRAWLSYNWRGWTGQHAYPVLYGNWRVGQVTQCSVFTTRGWVAKGCNDRAANVLVCQNRRDEDRGDYGVMLQTRSKLTSIKPVDTSKGISVSFFTLRTTAIMLEMGVGELRVFCYDFRQTDLSQLSERIITATETSTTLIHRAYETRVNFGGLEGSDEVRILFSGDSESIQDCILSDVKIYDTPNIDEIQDLDPILDWSSYNWFYEGAYTFVSTPRTQTDTFCKEGTMVSGKGIGCVNCREGYYQNLQNEEHCKHCPDAYRESTPEGQPTCLCSVGACDMEDSTDPPSEPPPKPTTKIVTTPKRVTTTEPPPKPTAKRVKATSDVPTTSDAPTTKVNTPPRDTSEAATAELRTTVIPTAKIVPTTKIVSLPKMTSEALPISKVTAESTAPEESEYNISRTCSTKSTTNKFGTFTWNEISGNESLAIQCHYPTGEFYATRSCALHNGTSAAWLRPDFSSCQTKADHEISRFTHVELTRDNAAEIAVNLRELTKNMGSMSSSGVEATVSVLLGLGRVTDAQGMAGVVDIGSNLLDAGEDSLGTSKDSLKDALANLAASVLEMSTEDTTIKTKNLDMITVKTKPDKPVAMSSDDTAIKIPQFLASKTDGIYLVIYKNAKLYKGSSSNESTMGVISDLYFSGIDVNNSPDEIELKFDIMKERDVNRNHIQCVYWEEKSGPEGDWSEMGCRFDETRSACMCNHATAFTAILSFTDQPEPDNDTVLYLEIVCFSLSILCCILFMVLVASIKGLRNMQSFKIHFNLAFALMLQYIAYLVLDLTDLQGLSCKVLGIFTHMVTLAAFFAMLTEAATIYAAIVLVFDTHVSRAVAKSALFCYGVPAVITGAFGGATSFAHYSDTCQLSGTYKLYLMKIPIICITSVNTVMFAMVTYKTVKQRILGTRRKGHLDPSQVFAQLKMMFTLNTMLGISFLVGIVADLSFYTQILYIVLNGLTGVYLLALFGIFNPMAQKTIQKSMRLTSGTNTALSGVTTHKYKSVEA